MPGRRSFFRRRVSREYAKADDDAAYHARVVMKNLPEQFHYNLMKLRDSYNTREAIVKDISYRQGFSDGVRFILQALVAGAQ